ncbi:alpha/beta fold hydrolase [Methylobacterium persicinum]|uniref:Pimeloyl-ACP methyl ester carboxylesterase n=1 Tax=Methylobacterium persicinum TaxID=374426 RepID=A0ABU0HL28_9HYPH|nr:alpha/beta hydrolase [Methylobacterium persicinum]MDQ0442405.1 pimeloyl-ACP methyl ester carboxylesterase [Methylobacterium persicinum]GJE37136.1 Epoxide hydrolase A [Methylobacterium persicinum]
MTPTAASSSGSLPPPEGVAFRRIALGSVTLHVAEAGPTDGPVLILLHGFPESWAGWRRQISPLAEAGWRVIVPDQRGYGASDKPDRVSAYHLDRLAGDVVALGQACGAERFYLAGHDWGGLVAWWTASFHPDRVARLAILNAPHPGIVGSYLRRHPGQWLRSVYVGVFQMHGLAETLLTARDGRALRRALSDTSRPGTFSPAELDAYARDWTAPGTMTAMLAWYRALVRLPRRHPPRVRMPVLILWGRKDHALQSGLAEASLNLCDRGRIVWFPRATHWVQHEEADTVNAELKAFFASGKTVDQAD